MRKRLQTVLMAGLMAAASFCFPPLIFQLRASVLGDGEDSIAASDEHGRKIFVNDFVAERPAPKKEAGETSRRKLMYWSSQEKRWKAVPPANAASMKAAKSAAAEVNELLSSGNSGRETSASANAKITAANFRANAAADAAPPMDVNAAIEQAAARHNVDPNLVRAVVKVESNFNPNAVSRKGAMGLMQLMPATARQLNVQNPFDPEQNVDAGVRHLKQLLDSYKGDVRLTLAAYNAGAGAVARSSGVPHFAETQNYVRRITGLYSSGSYGVGVPRGAAASALFMHVPVIMQRDARGVLYISNTD